jgi:hypothetical protein
VPRDRRSRLAHAARAATAGLRDDGSTAILPILRELLKQPSQLGPLLQVAADARARTTLIQARHAFEACGRDADGLSGARRVSFLVPLRCLISRTRTRASFAENRASGLRLPR